MSTAVLAADTGDLTESAQAFNSLSLIEIESIEFFISFFQILGVPKSVGEIYGLLFVAAEPVSMEQLGRRLSLSKGSVSQGLAVLRNLGAIKAVYVPGERRDHFEATFQLSKIAEVFIRDTLQPRMDEAARRLKRMRELAGALPAGQRELASDRVQSLEFWHNKAKSLLPMITKLLVR